MPLGTWLEKNRLEAEKKAEGLQKRIEAGQITIDNVLQLAVWQAREAAFREVERELGYEL